MTEDEVGDVDAGQAGQALAQRQPGVVSDPTHSTQASVKLPTRSTLTRHTRANPLFRLSGLLDPNPLETLWWASAKLAPILAPSPPPCSRLTRRHARD